MNKFLKIFSTCSLTLMFFSCSEREELQEKQEVVKAPKKEKIKTLPKKVEAPKPKTFEEMSREEKFELMRDELTLWCKAIRKSTDHHGIWSIYPAERANKFVTRFTPLLVPKANDLGKNLTERFEASYGQQVLFRVIYSHGEQTVGQVDFKYQPFSFSRVEYNRAYPSKEITYEASQFYFKKKRDSELYSRVAEGDFPLQKAQGKYDACKIIRTSSFCYVGDWRIEVKGIDKNDKYKLDKKMHDKIFSLLKLDDVEKHLDLAL